VGKNSTWANARDKTPSLQMRGDAVGGDIVRGDNDLSEEAMGEASVPAEATVCGDAAVSGKPTRAGVKLRLADGSESDCRAGIHLAREAHFRTIFRDIPFSEAKARAIFDKAVRQNERFGLIYAVPGGCAF